MLIFLSLLHLCSASTWSVPLTNESNVCFTKDFYVVSITIGTPPQQFTLVVDTAYPYIQVDSVECSDCAAKRRFDAVNSYFFRSEKEVGVDRGHGVLGQVEVAFAPDLVVENQTILVVRRSSDQNYRGFDGILVRARQGLGLGDGVTLVQNMKRRGLIPAAQFSSYFNIDYFGWVSREHSALSFGSWNLTRYSTEEKLVYQQAESLNGAWALPLSDPQFAGRRLDSGARPAILASAEEMIAIPEAIYNQIYDKVCRWRTCYAWKGVHWNCSGDHIYDELTFTLGQASITLTTKEYIRESGDWCYLRLKASERHWKLGTPFTSKYFIVFDEDQRAVGMAIARHEADMSKWLFWIIVGVVGILVLACVAGSSSNSESKKVK